MKEDFNGAEQALYSAIKELYCASWTDDAAEDNQAQKSVIDLLKDMDLSAHADFFYKKSKIVGWNTVEATPLEHLIFAAVGYDNYTLKGGTQNIRPEPLIYLLQNVELDPVKLQAIKETLAAAIARLDSQSFGAFKQKHGETGVQQLATLKSLLTDLQAKVLASNTVSASAVAASTDSPAPIVKQFKMSTSSSDASTGKAVTDAAPQAEERNSRGKRSLSNV